MLVNTNFHVFCSKTITHYWLWSPAQCFRAESAPASCLHLCGAWLWNSGTFSARFRGQCELSKSLFSVESPDKTGISGQQCTSLIWGSSDNFHGKSVNVRDCLSALCHKQCHVLCDQESQRGGENPAEPLFCLLAAHTDNRPPQKRNVWLELFCWVIFHGHFID